MRFLLIASLATSLACSQTTTTAPQTTRLSSMLASGGSAAGAAHHADTDDSIVRESSVSNRSGLSAVAKVNGRPIESRAFVKMLVEARGLMLLQQLIFLEAVRDEAEKRGVRTADEDIAREYDLTLKRSAVDSKDEAALTDQQRDVLIDEWAKRNGVSRDELAIAMARQSLLRKMAEADVRVTSDDVRAEFDRVSGEKVQVRHLQLAARRSFPRIEARLKRGDKFEDLVADYSVNTLSKANAGLLPPFTKNDPTVPREFSNVAFGLKVGQISPMFESEGSYHIIKLERRFDDGAGSLGEARTKIEREIRDRKIAEKMESMGREILMNANIRIDEETMRRQYADQRRRGIIEGPALAN